MRSEGRTPKRSLLLGLGDITFCRIRFSEHIGNGMKAPIARQSGNKKAPQQVAMPFKDVIAHATRLFT